MFMAHVLDMNNFFYNEDFYYYKNTVPYYTFIFYYIFVNYNFQNKTFKSS